VKAARGKLIASDYGEWQSLTPFHNFPLAWGVEPPVVDPDDPYRWFLFRPPFFGFLFHYWQSCYGGFRPDYELFLNPSTSLIGARVNLDCDDAEFDGLSQVVADAQIAFAFTPPVPGVLEVVVDVMNLKCSVDIDITYDWWLSFARVVPRNYITVSVLHPEGPETQLALMDESTIDTDGDDTSAHNNHLNTVQHYMAHFFTAQPVPGGVSAILTVGSRSVKIASASNMTVRSQTNYQWFLSSAEVRVVP
jgi:hypothetical protein